MKKAKRMLALAMATAMATSGVQLTGFGAIEAKAAPDISRVCVHDPSIFADNGKYYVFGSHIATASSTDLVNWTQVSTDYQDVDNNVIYGNVKENLKESFKWAGYDDGDCTGGYAVWAPDVIYNPYYKWEDGSKGAYMLYYSASSTWRRSCIGYMVSKTPDGGYEYGNTVVYSGFTNTGKLNYDGNSTRDTTWTKDYLPFNDLIKEGKIDGDASTWKCFNADGSWNNNYAPNAIDPTLFFDESGKHLYMVYGSWSGGLFILEIDKETGRAIYPGEDGVESTSGNYVDRYFGVHIAGGNHQSGEGPYIEYDKNTGYYYMYETYGGLTTTGGYNMRLFRSKNVYGPYVDPAGNEAGNSGVNCYKYGAKLIGNYQFFNQPGYRAAGHNSAMVTDDGKYYLFYHQRFLDSSRGEGHEVRVRQQFLNEDDWLVTAVYENRNEQIQKYSEEDVVGTYEYINHGNAEKDGSMLSTETVVLNEDGTITGDKTGSWTMSDGDDYTYVTLDIDGATYKGVFFEQTNDNGAKTMTFTAIGNNNLSVWGSKFDASDDVLASKVADQIEGILPKATREDVELPTSLSGAEISWESDNKSVLSNSGKVSSPKQDTEVTLTATITYGSASISKEYVVTVYDGPSIIAGYDFDSVDGTNVTAMESALNRESAKLMGDAAVVEDETRGEVLKVENSVGDKQVNYLSLPNDIFKNVDESGYTVSMWVNIDGSTWDHSALFEADWLADGATVGNYPMTRIGANLIGRINANDYSDAFPSLAYSEITGKWQQVTYTVNTNGIKVFLNGSEIVYDKKDISNCFSGKSAAIQFANHVMVGAGDIWGDEDCRNVLFDDIRIYDTALTASEVRDVYDATYKDTKDEPGKTEEPENPEKDIKPIQEEEPDEEGMTKAYVKLDNEKFFEAANVYAVDEDGNEIFGEFPGKGMAHIGNGWYSVNMPNEILASFNEDKENELEDEDKLDELEELEKEELEELEEDKEKLETKDVEKQNSEVSKKSEVGKIEDELEKSDTVKSSESDADSNNTEADEQEVLKGSENTDTYDSEEESLVDKVIDVISNLVEKVEEAFKPMTVNAEEHNIFKEGIRVSVNNGSVASEEIVTTLFVLERPSDDELKQEETKQEDTGKTDPVTPSPSQGGSSGSGSSGSSSGSGSSNSSASSSSSSSESSASTQTQTSSSAGTTTQSTNTVENVVTKPAATIADTQVPLAGDTTKTASNTKSKKANSDTVKTTADSEASDESEVMEDAITEEVTEESTVEESVTVADNSKDESSEKTIQDEEVATTAIEDNTNSGFLFVILGIIVIAAVAGAGVIYVKRK
ncbi:Beta-xylosidase [Pseudobutyrivibrio sp. YE44]|uniref:lipocalin-like domain-containing protein n=1 Tax=Pseudobutyrivibrio sp. YE44 TaxID=1520802 RepID=UPI0008879B09|nr:glycoside hydrolase family 43 C-terminal domain-containing protein [Pseudobutyrivibrio sp. YE44]SDB22806.1 Beta-xylosidase [Pseudobutyrivibrio sp. YE44]